MTTITAPIDASTSSARRRRAVLATERLHRAAVRQAQHAQAAELQHTIDELRGSARPADLRFPPVPRPAAQPVRLTVHAIERWAERVGAADLQQAGEALAAFVDRGHRRVHPPRRFPGVRAAPGVTFLVDATTPDVLAVVRAGVVVTVLGAGRRGAEADTGS